MCIALGELLLVVLKDLKNIVEKTRKIPKAKPGEISLLPILCLSEKQKSTGFVLLMNDTANLALQDFFCSVGYVHEDRRLTSYLLQSIQSLGSRNK